MEVKKSFNHGFLPYSEIVDKEFYTFIIRDLHWGSSDFLMTNHNFTIILYCSATFCAVFLRHLIHKKSTEAKISLKYQTRNKRGERFHSMVFVLGRFHFDVTQTKKG